MVFIFLLKPDTLISQTGTRFFGFQMNEIERALGRLNKAIDHLKDKLDNSMSASFLDDTEDVASVHANAQEVDLSELRSLKSQISKAIPLMEQLISEIDEAPDNIAAESKKDHQ